MLFTALLVWVLADEALAISDGDFVVVIDVADGDTVKVRGGEGAVSTVRLSQIDTPEMDQPGGLEAKKALAELVLGKTVRLRTSGKDRYNRYIAGIFLEGTDVNRTLVEQGHAWAYRRYLQDKSLIDLEGRAREFEVGLWNKADPIPPWEWRRGKRNFKPASQINLKPEFCSKKRTCSEMESCLEARRYLTECGLRRLDGDKDGVPCESICRT